MKGKLRGFVVAFAAVTLVASSASAAEQLQEDVAPARPVKYVGAELNPIATLAGLFGGQVQVGIAGPVTLQGGVSWFGTGESKSCAGSDGCSITPGGHGLVLEVGPRVFVPIHRPQGRPVTYLWFGPAFGHNWMTVEGAHGTSFEKNRAILDVGVHLPIGSSPVYVIGGLGYSKALDDNGAGELDHRSPNLASSLLDWTYPSQYVANGSSIRMLFAIGAGF